MKKIYQIPKSQLIVIIIFGTIGEFFTLVGISDSYDSNNFLGFLAIFIPFILVFYLVGWIHNRKEHIIKKEDKHSTVQLKEKNGVLFCIHCGSENVVDSKYCVSCGESIIS